MWVKRMAGEEPERLNYYLQRGVINKDEIGDIISVETKVDY